MRTTTAIAVLRHEQPTTDVWVAVEAVISAWEREGGPEFDRQVDFLREVELTDSAARDDLVARLYAVGAAVHVVPRNVLEPRDYEQAEYVGIFGVDLGPAFVSNADDAVVDSGPCPECGGHDELDVEQVADFQVDESWLQRPAAAGTRPPEQGWEVVGLPGGGLAVSRPLAEQLQQLEGVTFRDLLVGGVPSDRLVQVVAERSVLVPCRVHTRVEGAPHCPTCGRARGDVLGYFWVSPAQTGGRDLISRHRGRHAFLAASRPAMDLLDRHAPAGLWVHDVLRLCEH